MQNKVISIAADFSKSPGGRYRSFGSFSGEEFRDQILAPALRTAIRDGNVVTVQLDGTFGYPASFLEEAFGGLLRIGFGAGEVAKHLYVTAESPHMKLYRDMADEFIREAASVSDQGSRSSTAVHS